MGYHIGRQIQLLPGKDVGYNAHMSLYWKELEILPGMLLEVEMLRPDIFNDAGFSVSLRWRVLSFHRRGCHDAYIEYPKGKMYPLKKVVKSRGLQKKLTAGTLLQIPAGTDFMVVQEYQDGEEWAKKCFSLDMLGTVGQIRVID